MESLILCQICYKNMCSKMSCLSTQYAICFVNSILIFIPYPTLTFTTIYASLFTIVYSTLASIIIWFPDTISNLFEVQDSFVLQSLFRYSGGSILLFLVAIWLSNLKVSSLMMSGMNVILYLFIIIPHERDPRHIKNLIYLRSLHLVNCIFTVISVISFIK